MTDEQVTEFRTWLELQDAQLREAMRRKENRGVRAIESLGERLGMIKRVLAKFDSVTSEGVHHAK